jgi:uncharacterized RmlC-like cupin family protein
MIARKSIVSSALLLTALTGLTLAQQKPREIRLTPADVGSLPSGGASAGTSGVSGIETRTLSGDPTAAGPYTIALRIPANTQIQAHTHRDERTAVVVSGTWNFGYGQKAERTLEKALGPGSFYTEPAGVAHFARTGADPVIVYISGYGPTDTHDLDESADPRTPR